MKSIGHWVGEKTLTKKGGLTRRVKKMLMDWAMEAHNLDRSQPVGYYYNLFLAELRRKYKHTPHDEFMRAGIIE